MASVNCIRCGAPLDDHDWFKDTVTWMGMPKREPLPVPECPKVKA